MNTVSENEMRDFFSRVVDSIVGQTLVVQSMRHALEVARNDFYNLQAHVTGLEAKMGEVMAENDRLHQDVIYGQRAVAEAEQERDEARALRVTQAREYEDRITSLGKVYHTNLSEHEDRIRDLQEQLTARDMKLAEAEATVKYGMEEVESLSHEITTLKAEAEASRQSMAEALNSLASARAEVEDLNRALALSNADADRLRQELSDATGRLSQIASFLGQASPNVGNTVTHPDEIAHPWSGAPEVAFPTPTSEPATIMADIYPRAVNES